MEAHYQHPEPYADSDSDEDIQSGFVSMHLNQCFDRLFASRNLKQRGDHLRPVLKAASTPIPASALWRVRPHTQEWPSLESALA